MKIFFLIFVFFFIKPALSSEDIRCKFEEVYKDGSVQNGILLLKENKLRYQYLSDNLFTIFSYKRDFYYVRNNNYKIIQKVQENTELLYKISDYIKAFPNVPTDIEFNDIKINTEINHSRNFYKRISVISKDVTMSIYFNECVNLNLDQSLFIFNPMKKYVY